jgi:predicted ATPase
MGITEIRLRNFRGFRDATIELKPLTVLLGPNSAGKSSFGHALAAMAHAHRYFAGTPQANLTPRRKDAADWPVDLGLTRDLRTLGAEGPVKISLKTSEAWIDLGFGSDSIAELLPTYIRHPRGVDNATSRGVPIKDLPQVAEGPPLAETGVGEAVRAQLDDSLQYFELQRINERQWQDGGEPAIVILDGLVLNAATHERGTPTLLSGASQTDLRFFLENISYLRATRRRPSRTYELGTGRQQEIGYEGEWTASVLYKPPRPDPVTYVNLPPPPQSIEEAKKLIGMALAKETDTLVGAVQKWLKRLQLASSVSSEPVGGNPGVLELLVALEDLKTHNLTEVGFGVSQVLPILTAGLLQRDDSLLIVDLPEAHLHPRPQSHLADFFFSLALSGRKCLVETHSEMFFHRLRLRAAMHPDLIDKIAVYFIDQPKDGLCCQPRKVGLDYTDELEWPVGFFQEGWETETQINEVRQSRRVAKPSNA